MTEIGGRTVAFLTRHGRQHELPPHRVNYRANAWALRSLGVTQVLAPCAVGSLRADVGPGSLVLPDQLVDWTSGRDQTFHDEFEHGPVHASFADPYCARVRTAAAEAATDQGWESRASAPRWWSSTARASRRGPSRGSSPTKDGCSSNMTGHPEAVLARELGMCYATVALVTDLDAGAAMGEGVDVAR